MSGRIVIVGGVAAGASAAAKARRTDEDAEIVLVEAGPYMSFANCGLPYYLGGEIADRDKLFVADPEMFARRFNVDVRLNTTVTAIDRDARTVTLTAGDGVDESMEYDRLILATGTVPIRPPIAGLDAENIFTVRTVPDVDAITEFLHARTARETEAVAVERAREAPLRVVVIGGGYIGLEAAEQLHRRGARVTVVEMLPQLMGGALDAEIAEPLRESIISMGCDVQLSDGVAAIETRDGGSVAVTRSGRDIPFDLGILAVGVRPNVELAIRAGLELGETGAIRVDSAQRTSDANIYAAGDNAEHTHIVLGRPINIPLAGPANKTGRVAGANAALDLTGAADDDRRRLSFRGVLGTAVVRVGQAVAGVTGLTETLARAEGMDYEVTLMPGASHAGYYPGAQRLVLKLVWDAQTGRLLGAQGVGGDGVDKRLDVFATAIAGGMSVEDLEQLDLCYAPPFGSAKDPVIMAGFAAANTRRGEMPSVPAAVLLDELAGDAPPTVIDVRSQREYEAGHLDEAINIPVDEIRERIDEVPTDRPVALHCGVGYRSYVAQRILINRGRKNVRNILGGYGMLVQARKSRTT